MCSLFLCSSINLFTLILWDLKVVPLFVPCNIFYHIAECSLSSMEVGMVAKQHYNLVDLYVQFIFVFVH